MSYIATRTFLHHGLADVFAFKTKRKADRWVADIRTFWEKAIKHKQVRIDYVGKTRLPCGVYYGSKPGFKRTSGEKHTERLYTRSTCFSHIAHGSHSWIKGDRTLWCPGVIKKGGKHERKAEEVRTQGAKGRNK